MVRILHVLTRDASKSTIRQLQLLCDCLSRDNFSSHVCSLETNSRRRERLVEFTDEITFCGLSWNFDATFLRRFGHYVRTVNPDIVHCWGGPTNSLLLLANKLYGRQPVVANVGLAAERSSYSQIVNRWLHASSYFIVQFESEKANMLRSGLPLERITVVSPGVQFSTESTVRSLHAEFDLLPKAKLIAAMGDLTLKSRFKDLIWALDLLRVIHPDAHLVIAGDGDDKKLLQEYAQSVGISAAVHFLGDRNDTDHLLAQCFCYWHASESDTASVLQAMAKGLPIVSADVPTHQDVVSEGESGNLVPVGDCAAFARHTNLLLRNPSAATRMGELGRNVAKEKFSAESMARDFAAVYERALRRTVAA